MSDVVGFTAGSRIAGYRLEEQIGRGGMAVVFRARDERLGRLVALKILAPSLAGDEAFRQRFIRESRAAAAIDDPHIVPVFEAGDSDGVLFIAMRYVPGGDAQTLLHNSGPLPPSRVAAIISPVASALDAAHAAGLLHRDVKPSNMLVDSVPGRPDHVYLSDFGLSKGASSGGAGLTQTGQVMGTLDYMPPEQIMGRPADGRSDAYSLACSAFEMLTGAPPFRRDEPTAVMYAQMSEPPPPVSAKRAGLPAGTDAILARGLAKTPEERYPNCREFADALRGAFGFPPYDSGPQAVPHAAIHPQTEAVWPGATPPGGAGTPAAADDDATSASTPSWASPTAAPAAWSGPSGAGGPGVPAARPGSDPAAPAGPPAWGNTPQQGQPWGPAPQQSPPWGTPPQQQQQSPPWGTPPQQSQPQQPQPGAWGAAAQPAPGTRSGPQQPGSGNAPQAPPGSVPPQQQGPGVPPQGPGWGAPQQPNAWSGNPQQAPGGWAGTPQQPQGGWAAGPQQPPQGGWAAGPQQGTGQPQGAGQWTPAAPPGQGGQGGWGSPGWNDPRYQATAAASVPQAGGGPGMTHGMTPGGALPGAPGYAPPGAPPGGPKPRRRMLLIGVPVIVVLAIIGLVAGLAAGGSSGPGLPVPLVKINAKSQAAALTGYTYVQYNSGAASNAQIYGVIRHARKGEVAQLYAQQFPYHQAPVQVTSVILHPTQGRASYQFQVTPILATHYVVKIIQDKTSSTVLGSSPVTTVYVIAGGNSGSNPTCARPVCHLSFATTTFVPPPALATEMAKRWYTYFAITFSPSKEPPAPATLALGAGSPQLSGEKQVGDNEYTETVTFTTTVGNNGYTWAWLACTKDTESADGVGLPGSHGCGNPTAPRTGPYIG